MLYGCLWNWRETVWPDSFLLWYVHAFMSISNTATCNCQGYYYTPYEVWHPSSPWLYGSNRDNDLLWAGHRFRCFWCITLIPGTWGSCLHLGILRSDSKGFYSPFQKRVDYLCLAIVDYLCLIYAFLVWLSEQHTFSHFPALSSLISLQLSSSAKRTISS